MLAVHKDQVIVSLIHDLVVLVLHYITSKWNRTISYYNGLLQRHCIIQQGILWDSSWKQCRLNLKEEFSYKSVVINAVAL
jgi:hypothetical protein